jgi:ubiquitin C-terminal hydrolase
LSDSEKTVDKSEEEKVKAPAVYKCCDNPQITYYGVVNLNIDERTIGSVDVWRCGVCKRQFCEEKQLGIEELAEVVGMPKIDPDAKWAVSVCKLQQGKYKWKLVKLKENSTIQHECLDEKVISLKSENFKIEDEQHWSFLIEDNVNKAIEI